MFTLALLLLSSQARAGRPVFQELDLTQLVERSDVAMAGWPSPKKPESPCGKPAGMWQINYVIKGDPSLKHKVIPVYPSGYHFYAQAAAEGKPGPSYQAFKYGASLAISEEHKSTILFLKKEGECWEFTAAGGQEELRQESVIRSLVNPLDCRAQKEAIRAVLYKLPLDCSADSDCKGVNLHPNECERPRALNVKASSLLPPEWAGISARARIACASEWKKESSCVPGATSAYCRGGQCRLGVNPPRAPDFQEASMSESCAPSDGPSTSIVFSNGGSKAYPRLAMNWWGPSRPLRKPGDYNYTGENDLSGSYCTDEKNCAMLKNLHGVVHVKDETGGDAEVEGTTFDGAPIRIKSPLKILPMQKIFCG